MSAQALTMHQAQARRIQYAADPVLPAIARAHERLGRDETVRRLSLPSSVVAQLVAAAIELERATAALAEASRKGETLDRGIEDAVLRICASLNPSDVARAKAHLAELEAPAPSPSAKVAPNGGATPVPPVGRRGR